MPRDGIGAFGSWRQLSFAFTTFTGGVIRLFHRLALLNRFIVGFLGGFFVWAQEGRLTLRIISSENRPLPYASVFIAPFGQSYTADSVGEVKVVLPAGRYRLKVSHLSAYPTETEVKVQAAANTFLTISLVLREVALDSITVRGERVTPTALPTAPFLQPIPIRTEALRFMPSVKADIESRLVLMGAMSSSELSSQYRVRGGNFDENLIYAGEVEIYRPFSARSGQQEGLGFTNPLLLEEVYFSTGGFEARYGDRLSSVLQVSYKRRDRPETTIDIGLLTQSFATSGKVGGVYYTLGARRFAIGYLLNTLPVRGEYRPVFYDGQAYLCWIRKDSTGREVSRLEGISTGLFNRYRLLPRTGEATFGLINAAFRVRFYFAGAEELRYRTGQQALVWTWRPSPYLRLTHQVSYFGSLEDEIVDVEGAYLLGEVQTSLGSQLYNEIVVVRGAGSQIRRIRNFLDIHTLYAEQRGEWFWDKELRRRLLWGVRVQGEAFTDRVYEWSALDSADYVEMDERYFWNQRLSNRRLMGFIQQGWRWGQWRIEAGTRFHYSQVNRQLLFSPRVQVLYQPTNQLQLRIGGGHYAQPPFYRELRAIDYRLVPTVRAQQSFQLVVGADYTFTVWERPFRYFTELYYKHLWDLIPYEIENVRLRYYGANLARGYAYGIDLRLNGEFLRGVDSWVAMGLLSTREYLPGIGWMRRPSDQRFSFALYLQDELPTNPLYKVSLQLVWATGTPFGVPRRLAARTVFQMPSYGRADVGFSRLFLIDKKYLRSLWIGLDVFNLFQRYNVVSYQWIADVYGIRWAVPNYLSARLVNLRVIGEF
ncbi:MAG: TonB-dependent receptor [Bacteroidia bacterium]|nr:TonB-dependent receptor [Bacteroidia bacterium]MDW8058030.1 TonB-dependent receptor [Bacteroidia bacterium]